MKPIIKAIIDKIQRNIDDAVATSRTVMEEYQYSYPLEVITATNKMFDEIQSTRITIADTTALDDSLKTYKKAVFLTTNNRDNITCSYSRREL